MRKFLLNKLVRDKVLDNMLRLGQQVDYVKLNNAEFGEALQAKILEEAKEIDLKNVKVVDELADLMEAIEAAALKIGSNLAEVQKVKAQRLKERGAFRKRAFVKTLMLEDDDPWVKYYAKDPEKFPEQS